MQHPAGNNLIDLFATYFPHGLKLLLVGIDVADEAIIEKELPNPYYQIVKCSTVASTFGVLRQSHNDFDLVISDISLPDMDGFLFIRDQNSRTNIPHIVIFEVERSGVEIAKALGYGACFVLWKPLRCEGELRNLWQHACRRREQHPTIENNLNNVVNDNSFVDHADGSSLKKRRLVWDNELHELFLHAVDRLGGPKNAKPKSILTLMNKTFLSIQNVSSHLQKHRENTNGKQGKQYVNAAPMQQVPPLDLGEIRSENHTPNPLPQNPPPQSHFTIEDLDLWYQRHDHELSHHLVQMQPPEHGHALPPPVPSSFIGNGSNNQTSGTRQLDLASGSSYGSKMQRFDQSQSPSTSLRRNIQQPQTITQNLNSHMQKPDQSPVSGSSNVATTGGVNDGIIKAKLEALHLLLEMEALCSSLIKANLLVLHLSQEVEAIKAQTSDAKPKSIRRLMNKPFLTRHNVASHLQKHRENLKKNQGNQYVNASNSST